MWHYEMGMKAIADEVGRLTATVIANVTGDVLIATAANNDTDADNITTADVSTSRSSTVPTTPLSPTIPSSSEVTSSPFIPIRSSFHMMAIFTTALFIAGTLLIIKVVLSHNKKRRSLMASGSARWRLSASATSAQGGRMAGGGVTYSPMSTDGTTVNSMDIPLPESRVDWERQFFDEDVYNQPVWDPSSRTRPRLNLESDPQIR
uniref:Transmembrane protein n=2 Tax=Parascaris univalens TaxID=6257 RepID=A0A914ZV63_PARUN